MSSEQEKEFLPGPEQMIDSKQELPTIREGNGGAREDKFAPEIGQNTTEYAKKVRTDIESLTAEIASAYPDLAKDLPTIDPTVLPKEYGEDWEGLDNDTKTYLAQQYLQKLRLELVQIRNQIGRLQEGKQLDSDEKEFRGTPVECANFWASLNPVLLRHIYDIIRPTIPDRKTVRETVRHSIDYTVGLAQVDWADRLRYLTKYPGCREESCFSQGQAPGGVVLEVDADVRMAFPRDVGSTVNPYTGEKVVGDKVAQEALDLEEYFQSKPAYEKSLHSHSDELFARFDIWKDLKRVIVYDVNLVGQVRQILKENNLPNVLIEFSPKE
jgi:hypothetical protein